MTGYDTAPTADELAAARESLTRDNDWRTPGLSGEIRKARVFGYAAATLRATTEAATPDEARRIARARAMFDAYDQLEDRAR